MRGGWYLALGCAVAFATPVHSASRFNPDDIKAYKAAHDAIQAFESAAMCDSSSENIPVLLRDLRKATLELAPLAGLTGESPDKFLSLHAGLAFEFADLAKDRGCLEIADRTYRDLIVAYPAAGDAGIRDRAKLGVDDIRELRRTSAPK